MPGGTAAIGSTRSEGSGEGTAGGAGCGGPPQSCRADVCAESPPSGAFGARPSRARSSRSPVACVRLAASRCSRLRRNRISSRPRGALLPRAFCAPGARNNSCSSACRAWGGPPSFAPPTGRRPSGGRRPLFAGGLLPGLPAWDTTNGKLCRSGPIVRPRRYVSRALHYIEDVSRETAPPAYARKNTVYMKLTASQAQPDVLY